MMYKMNYPPEEYHNRDNKVKAECNLCGSHPSRRREYEETYQHFRIEVGVFRSYDEAFSHQMVLFRQGVITEIVYREMVFIVYTEDFLTLEDAVFMEQKLRFCGYNTSIFAS